MKSLELLIEKIILSSRWILVVFYLGLVAALALLGPRIAAAQLFPLGYMLTLVPFGDELIPFLQTITAKLTMDMLAKGQRTPLQWAWCQTRVDDPVELAGLRFPNRVGMAAGLDVSGTEEVGAALAAGVRCTVAANAASVGC